MIDDVEECNRVARSEMLNNAGNMVRLSERDFYVAARMCEAGQGEDLLLQTLALNQNLIRTTMDEVYGNGPEDPERKRKLICNQANVLANMFLVYGGVGDRRFDDEVGRAVEKLKKIASMIKGSELGEEIEKKDAEAPGEPEGGEIDLEK